MNSRAITSPAVGKMDHWLAPCLMMLIWLPAMIAAAPVWLHGQYYDYGWFVPPAAGLMTVARWRGSATPVRPLSRVWVWIGLGLLPWVLLLRILGHVDPSWRLPIWTLGMTAVVVGHSLLAAARGCRDSAKYLWITLFLMSALPWPSVVESGMIHWLTGKVVESTAVVFQLFGRPVEVIGDQLRLHDVTVEVTDGCSGVRSFQSFFMATWFFAEIQRLRVGRVMVLCLASCAVAFLVNMARTYGLAAIRFERGEGAFRNVHDLAGILSFAVSAFIFYWLSGWLAGEKRMLVRADVKSSG